MSCFWLSITTRYQHELSLVFFGFFAIFSFSISFPLLSLATIAMADKKSPRESSSRVQPLLFDALEAVGSNYMEWSIDVKAYFSSEELDDAIDDELEENFPMSSKWKALLILRRHLHTSLRQQYIQVDTSVELWRQLHARFYHERTIFLP